MKILAFTFLLLAKTVSATEINDWTEVAKTEIILDRTTTVLVLAKAVTQINTDAAERQAHRRRAQDA